MKKTACLVWVLLVCNISFSQEKKEQSTLENKTKNVVFKSYPNPIVDQLFVIGTFKIISIEFLDVSGSRVAFYKYNKSIIKVNVSDFEKGIYILKVIDERDEVEIKRLVKK